MKISKFLEATKSMVKKKRRRKLKPFSCKTCGSLDRKQSTKGMCKKCYQLWRYHNIPKDRERRKEYQQTNENRKSYLKNYMKDYLKNNPEQLEKHRKRMREYARNKWLKQQEEKRKKGEVA